MEKKKKVQAGYWLWSPKQMLAGHFLLQKIRPFSRGSGEMAACLPGAVMPAPGFVQPLAQEES